MDIQGAIKEAIFKLNSISIEYKPDGIGGSCNCDACEAMRPTYKAIETALAALKTMEWIENQEAFENETMNDILDKFQEYLKEKI